MNSTRWEELWRCPQWGRSRPVVVVVLAIVYSFKPKRCSHMAPYLRQCRGSAVVVHVGPSSDKDSGLMWEQRSGDTTASRCGGVGGGTMGPFLEEEPSCSFSSRPASRFLFPEFKQVRFSFPSSWRFLPISLCWTGSDGGGQRSRGEEQA